MDFSFDAESTFNIASNWGLEFGIAVFNGNHTNCMVLHIVSHGTRNSEQYTIDPQPQVDVAWLS
jgi:hypothetical protein